MVQPAERLAHRDAIRSELQRMAQHLLDVLSAPVLTAATGMRDPNAVYGWAHGTRGIRADAERNLRNAYQIVTLMEQQECPATIKAWFMGMNPELNDQPPAALIPERPQEVIAAARYFLWN
jgi:hypothetical protein